VAVYAGRRPLLLFWGRSRIKINKAHLDIFFPWDWILRAAFGDLVAVVPVSRPA
jgi:hypothetical protein